MRVIKELREAGFTIANAPEAIECTKVESAQPFYYFNPKFCDTCEEIAQKLKPADEDNGRYSIIIAGDYHTCYDSVELPFALISQRAYNDIQATYESLKQAKEDVRRREDTLKALVTSLTRN